MTTTGPHHRITPPEKQAAVLADLKSGRFYVFEIWFLVPMPKGPLETYLGY